MNTVHPTLAELVADIASRAPNEADRQTLRLASQFLAPASDRRELAAERVAAMVDQLIRRRVLGGDAVAITKASEGLRDALVTLAEVGEGRP